MRGDDLAKLLRNHPDVRLVYLSACEGALGSGQSAFAGVAQALVRGGAPAAVAMQAEISDAGAIELARAFYTALAAGRPVDAALTQARVALSAAGSLEWAIPVLFSRSPDNRLFDIRQVLPTPDCPYPGMVPFGEDQQALFFGRDKEFEEVVERLRQHPFLAIIGPSGSGKSSLVFAGVIPALRSARRFGPGEWAVKTMRPGDSRTADGKTAPLLVLAELLGCAPDEVAGRSFEQRTLLVVDQFEELFTLAGAEEAQSFLDALPALMTRPNLYILLTARADFYSDLMACPLWPAIRANRLELTPLGDDELWAAIVEPAGRVGVTIDEALAVRLIADAAGERERGSLPLVQETLVLLWEKVKDRRLSLLAYRGMGDGGRSGLQVAIDRRASSVYDNLPDPAQPLARRTFLRLIQFGEGRADTRRQQTVDELRASGDDPALFDATLARLVESRLLTASGEAGGARRVDIAHEALITGWPRLRGWLEDRQVAEQARRRLEAKAVEWVASDKRSGLLDEYELQEAEHWLASEDAQELGFSQDLVGLVTISKAAITQAKARGAEAERSRRRSRLLAGGLALATLVIVLVVYFAGAARSAQMTAEDSQAEALAAKAEVERLARNIRADQLTANGLKLANDNAPLALLLSVEGFRTLLDQGEEVLPSAQTNMHELLQAVGGMPLTGHRESVSAVAFSPDGRWLATGSSDGTARLWNMTAVNHSAQPIELAGHDGAINAVAFSPDSRWLVTGSQDRTARLWDVEAKNPSETARPLTGHTNGILAVGFGPNPDDYRLATADADGRVRLWDMTSADPGEASIQLTGHISTVNDLAFSPDGRWLATGSLDETARLWHLASDDPSATAIELADNEGGIWDVAFSPDGRLLVTSAFGGKVRLWDTSRADPGAQPVEFSNNGGIVAGLSSDGKWLAAVYGDNAVQLWNLRATSPNDFLTELWGHEEMISAIAFSPDGRWLATGSCDYAVRLWDLTAQDPRIQPVTLAGHSNCVTDAEFSPDGRHLVTASDDGTARLWDMTNTFAQPYTLNGNGMNVSEVAFSPNGNRLASASDDGIVQLWDVTVNYPTSAITLTGHYSAVQSVEYSTDGLQLATGSLDGSVLLWDLTGPDPGSQPANPFEPDDLVWDVALSPDGRWLAAVTPWDSAVRLWDLASDDKDQQPKDLRGHTGGVWAATFSPDSRWLATVWSDRSVLLWNTASQESAPIKLDRPTNAPAALALSSPNVIAFSPDGRWLATALEESTVRLWDMASIGGSNTLVSGPTEFVDPTALFTAVAFSGDGEYLAAVTNYKAVKLWDMTEGAFSDVPIDLVGRSQTITSPDFSHDGRWLATARDNGAIELWRWRVEDLVELACQTVGRNLTHDEWRFYMGDDPYRPTCPQWPAAAAR